MEDILVTLREQIAECKKQQLREMGAFLQGVADELVFLRAQVRALKSQVALVNAASAVVADQVNGHG